MTTTTAQGRAGEDIAVLHLERAGLTVVGRNVRVGRGEVDVVAKDGDVLVFVEVRRRKRAGDALASVGKKKRALLVRAAQGYLAALAATGAALPVLRFDVVLVAGDQVDHLRGAFEPAADPTLGDAAWDAPEPWGGRGTP